jgi:four helix bundle protein
MSGYRELLVWQKAMTLVERIYIFTKSFPKEEIYGLTSQMRRCAISIPSNIAEGSKRASKKEFRQFLMMAYASGAELETQLEISSRIGFAEKKEEWKSVESLLTEVMKMLNSLLKSFSV